MNNRFQEKLQKQIFVLTVLLIVASIVIFSSTLFLYAEYVNHEKLNKAETKLYDLLDQTYAYYEEHLKQAQHNEKYISFIKSDASERNMQISGIYDSFYNLNKDSLVKSNLVLTDRAFNVIFHTVQDPELGSTMTEFNKIINQRINGYHDIESGTINGKNKQLTFMLSAGIYDGDEQLIGYVSYYLNQDDFNYQLSNQQSDSVIMDHFGNVIAISNRKFVEGALSRVNPAFMKDSFTLENTQYITSLQGYSKQGIQLLSIVAVEDNRNQILLGTVVIIVMGGALLLFSRYFSMQLSRKMTTSVSLLCHEIDAIKQGDLDHQVVLRTDDEFETIANNMNEMIEEIKLLTNRNAELNYLSKISEIKQLEAQFNPHFLYNTLETIRYSILMDDGVASDMIIKLTKILRYSINEDVDKVSLKKDLEFIHLFLMIEKYRFKERFTYDIDVSQDCLERIVPKLILQPLIENSIKNGFKHKDSLHIDVRGRMFGKVMKLWVVDDGIGIQPEELSDIRSRLGNVKNDTNHHGLFNTNRRLYLQYGEGSQLEIFSEYRMKTTVIMTIIFKEDV